MTQHPPCPYCGGPAITGSGALISYISCGGSECRVSPSVSVAAGEGADEAVGRLWALITSSSKEVSDG